MMISFLVLALLTSKSFQDNLFLKVEDFFSEIKGNKCEEEYYSSVAGNLIDMLQGYVYLDIAKAPPTNDSTKDYFIPNDAEARLNKIKNKEKTFTDFYDFYREIFSIFNDFRDLHTSIQFEKNCNNSNLLNRTFVVSPLNLIVKAEEGKPKVYGKQLGGSSKKIYEYFWKDSEEVIKKNVNTPINSINGLSPFEWIQSFGKGYRTKLKSTMGDFFLYSFIRKNFWSLLDMPLEEEDFLNFTVVYENGDYFIANFIFFIQDFKREKDSLFDDLLYERIPKRTILKKDNITWDIENKESTIRCKVDSENGVNIYVMNSFLVSTEEEYNEYLNVMLECQKHFQKNVNPLIVIEIANGGGLGFFAELFQEIVQPLSVNRKYVSFKDNQETRQLLKKNNRYNGYYTVDTCKNINSLDEFYSNSKTDTYNDTVQHRRSGFYTFFPKNDRVYLDNMKKSLRFKNAPTEIVIFTDGYSYSATSIFLKGIRNTGSGIIVGYGGNPEIPLNQFDISQSSSSVLNEEWLKEINPVAYENLKELGVKFATITFAEIFEKYASSDNPIPEEYTVDPVDESVFIYPTEKDLKLDLFIKEGKRILEKYKTKCNPKNKGLMLQAEECYDLKEYPNAHGGYLCGDDGRWSTECSPFYCDIGYYFDKASKACIKDPCSSSTNLKGKHNYSKMLFEIDPNYLKMQ